MKQFTLFFFLSIATITVSAQEIQVLYDFGKNCNIPYTMIQKYQADRFGSTYFFVSMGYNVDNNRMNLSYWESPISTPYRI